MSKINTNDLVLKATDRLPNPRAGQLVFSYDGANTLRAYARTWGGTLVAAQWSLQEINEQFDQSSDSSDSSDSSASSGSSGSSESTASSESSAGE